MNSEWLHGFRVAWWIPSWCCDDPRRQSMLVEENKNFFEVEFPSQFSLYGMAEEGSMISTFVLWREKRLNVVMNQNSTLLEFGLRLQKLTNVKPDTMRLIVPRSTNRSSRLLTPFLDEHSKLTLQEVDILEGKSIRMMGVFANEVEEILQNSSKDLRIAGFEEEEKRLRQRMLGASQMSLKLPQGPYIFCDFRTLQIPGIELNPPATEALRRMHMLACDPGIVAIMNKHRWRVGIMTELAPVGYVGVSPKCILGFNMNHGEEISLRLRTDDLKGFRKYESIKKTLLHELAHMVYSEHDDDFFTLNRQLNQEAESLDWTKSKGYSLGGSKFAGHNDTEFQIGASHYSQKLGGGTSDLLIDARASSVAAAYRRILNAPTTDCSQENIAVLSETPMEIDKSCGKEQCDEPDPDDSNKVEFEQQEYEPDPDDSQGGQPVQSSPYMRNNGEPCPYKVISENKSYFEPDPDDSEGVKNILGYDNMDEPDPDDCQAIEASDEPKLKLSKEVILELNCREPDPDDCDSEEEAEPDPDENMVEPDPDDSQAIEASVESQLKLNKQVILDEPDPDDCEFKEAIVKGKHTFEADPSDDSKENKTMEPERDPDDVGEKPLLSLPIFESSVMKIDEPDTANTEKQPSSNAYEKINENSVSAWAGSDQELRRIQDPVSIICARIQKAIEILRSEATPVEAISVLQTLTKIIRNVIEHPDELKFRRLRKANPIFQRNVANYKAAIEVLQAIGFYEEILSDEIGKAEAYFILKRNDPGLLWLAKSSLEQLCIA